MKCISVLIRCLNVEKTIDRALSSIINQTYENLEIIIINDGSTDNSQEILERYACQYDNIRLYTQDNKGNAAVGNRAIDLATGDYIIFFDADDYAKPEAYAKMVEEMEKNDADMVICDYERTSGRDNIGAFRKPGLYKSADLISHFLDDTINAHFWNKLCRKELYEDVRFPCGRKFEDIATAYKLCYKSNKIVILSERLFIYTDDNERSISHDSAANYRKKYDIILAYREKFDFARNNNIAYTGELLEKVALYNTNFYREFSKDKSKRSEITVISDFFKKNKHVFLFDSSIDLIRKYYIWKISK